MIDQSVKEDIEPLRLGLPYRGTFGCPRPPRLHRLALPPGPMPSHWGTRPLKAWRYVGVFGPELMICAAEVRIGRARQSFWALWDRIERTLYEHTSRGRRQLHLAAGRMVVAGRSVQLDLRLSEQRGVETVCTSGRAYGWTRKQADVQVGGTVELPGRARRELAARAVIDDTAAYYARHTQWRWSAGVGRSLDGRSLAWNLVSGVNDPPAASERTVWVDGQPREVGPCAFASDLSRVGGLSFHPEAVRARDDNLLLVRSIYRQPFGIFRGELADGLHLAEGYGVMEEHDAWW